MKESDIHFDFLANHNSEYINEIAELKFNQWKKSYPERSLLDRKQETIQSCNLDKFPITFICHYSSTLIGFVTVVKCENKFEYIDCYWLVALFIKEKYRKKGLATNLLLYTENELKLLNIKKIYLWSESEELGRYYKKRNWDLEKQIIDRGENIAIFSKIL